ncbi:hypothetical protein [Bifidobacterium xylocopae]|uniref:Uncharacterized protein n=1 Tax=Bifidobacterium xylocopae TaxID=2493119 RepID=A0A366KAR6_9BIFI|nr:hypothetical protein [Bifidobacterium xylocopae]RBP98820.1 hypothetical protein CRD59_07145 [Bifidobacterium xylocopae]
MTTADTADNGKLSGRRHSRGLSKGVVWLLLEGASAGVYALLAAGLWLAVKAISRPVPYWCCLIIVVASVVAVGGARFVSEMRHAIPAPIE